MTLQVGRLTRDARDCALVARFWAEALSWEIADDKEHAVYLVPREALGERGAVPGLLIFHSPNAKAAKNRAHLDLRPDDQVGEVSRLEALGTTRVDIGQIGNEGWIVMAEPEGNELCVLGAK
jgi:hypothetical protein